MPAVARFEDDVTSIDGGGEDCLFPITTYVDECNTVNVYCNGLLVPNEGVKVAPHPLPGCGPIPDESTLSTVSDTVYIGGRGIGRVEDSYEATNTIVTGSPNVFSG